MRSKILIVDDNPTNIEVVEELLDDSYDLRSATTGEEALQAASDFQPDVILLDIMMPGMNGYEVCQHLRKNQALRHTKVIMVSAKAMTSERLAGYEAGADDYVTKPFDNSELLAKIRVYLRLKSSEEVSLLKSNVLSLLNHEYRTPLSSILAVVELLLVDDEIDLQERRTLLGGVRGAALRLEDLFKKVLKLSALKSGTVRLQLGRGDLCDVVGEVTSALQSKASQRGVSVELDVPDSACATFDRNEILGVAESLVDNAIRFSPEGGVVTVCLSSDGDHLCLTVRDQGEAIDPAYLSQMFEEFLALDVVHHTEGHGLSLAIAKEIVENHNGNIGVESHQGSGTCFTVRLPAVAQAEIEGSITSAQLLREP